MPPTHASDVPRRRLAELVTRFGWELGHDSRRTIALLRDVCGDYRREIRALGTAIEERVVIDLLAEHGQLPIDSVLARLQRRLHAESGMDEQVSAWTVHAWAFALGLVTEEFCNRASSTQRYVPTINLDAETTENAEVASGGTVIAVAATQAIPACPVCRTPSPGDESFCTNCGTAAHRPCPSCRVIIRSDYKFCPNCRSNIVAALQFEPLLSQARASLATAQQDGPLAERLQQALLAAKHFTQAHKAEFDAPNTGSQADKARALAASLACALGEEAYAERRLSDAVRHFQTAIGLEPGTAAAQTRLAKIAYAKQSALSTARDKLCEGRPQAALAIVRKIRGLLPDDADVSALFEQCENRAVWLQRALQEEVPALQKEKKFSALRQLLQEIDTRGERVADLKDYATKLTSQLQVIAAHLRPAEQSLAQGDYEAASRIAGAALEEVSDHPEALRIYEQAKRCGAEAQEHERLISSALVAARGFESQRLILLAGKSIPAALRERLALRAGTISDGARNYSRLLAVVFLGGMLWLASGKLTWFFIRGIETSLTPHLSTIGYFSTTAAQFAFGAAAQLFFSGILLHLFCMTGFAKSSFGRIAVWFSIAIFAPLVMFAVMLVSGYMKNSVPAVKGGILVVSAILYACYGAAVGLSLTSLAQLIFKTSRKISSIAPVLIGALGAALIVGSSNITTGFLPDLTVALSFAGLIAVTGLSRGRLQFALAPIAAFTAHTVRVGMHLNAGAEGNTSSCLITALVLTCSWALISFHEMNKFKLLLAAALAFATSVTVIEVTRYMLVPDALILLNVWFLVWGMLAVGMRDQIQLRFQYGDWLRYAAAMRKIHRR